MGARSVVLDLMSIICDCPILIGSYVFHQYNLFSYQKMLYNDPILEMLLAIQFVQGFINCNLCSWQRGWQLFCGCVDNSPQVWFTSESAVYGHFLQQSKILSAPPRENDLNSISCHQCTTNSITAPPSACSYLERGPSE